MEKNESLNLIKKNTVISSISLFFQSGYSAVLGFIANLVLTVLLTPKIFGIYFTVLSLIAILNYFSDIGLAASLIQKKEISDDDVATVFTVQQILIISIILIGYFATKPIMNFYHLTIESQYLYWALLFSFFLSSLKTIPSIFLERKINFQKIVLVQILENTVFYLMVIALAIAGKGLTSFTYAVIIRSLTGVITIYIISPWKIRIKIRYSSLKKLLSFGLPFQISSFLALVKDDLLTLYLGKVLGFQTLGYIGWAKKWAESPIRIIMDSLSRVLFPLFSKFQSDLNKLKNIIEKTIFYQSAIVIPATFGLAIIMSRVVDLIPKYGKWSPALPYFYLFCASALLSSFSTPFINLLNGLGKVRISFYFMVAWTILTWILVPSLTLYYHGFGFPISLLLLSLSFTVVISITKKIIDFSFIKNVYKSLLSSLVMSLAVLTSFYLLPNGFLFLIITIIIGIITYLFFLKVVFRINLFTEIWKTFQRS